MNILISPGLAVDRRYFWRPKISAALLERERDRRHGEESERYENTVDGVKRLQGESINLEQTVEVPVYLIHPRSAPGTGLHSLDTGVKPVQLLL